MKQDVGKDGVDQDSLRQCYHFLNTTSRSFAAVVLNLHEELRDAVSHLYARAQTFRERSLSSDQTTIN